MNLDGISGIECRSVTHLRRDDKIGRPDTHIIKELIHYKDGSKKKNIRLIKDFKRSFYVTKPAYRNHREKKEREHIDKLKKYDCTQSDLRDSVARALGKPYVKASLRQLADSPYLYGSDVPSTSLIRSRYHAKWPDITTPHEVAAYDVETDVLGEGADEGRIIMASVTSSHELFISILEEFVEGFYDPKEQIRKMANKLIGKYIDKRKLKVYINIGKDEESVIKEPFKYLHELKPDILAIWDIDFDIPKLMERCAVLGIDIAELFRDPSIPPELRYFRYNQGPKTKVKGGVEKPIPFAQQWHTVSSAASFTVLCAMRTYRLLRLGAGEEPSYSLNAILDKILGIRKLGIAEADDKIGLEFHTFMQQHHKIEYCVYNMFDTLSMIELEETTMDLSLVLGIQLGFSDYTYATKLTKRVDDVAYYEALKDGEIAGTVPSNHIEKEEVLSKYGWILTLPAHLNGDTGLVGIKGHPDWITNIWLACFDEDVVGSYPGATEALNASKKTNRKEIIAIEGIPEDVFRLHNINLLCGHVNAVDYGITMFNMPKPKEITEMLLKECA